MKRKGGFRHVPGKGCMVACRGCGDDHPEGPWPTTTEMFAAMEAHGWIKGPDLCTGCQDSYGAAEAAGLVSFRKDAWDNVVEIAPGVWAEKAPRRRRRRIRRLL